MWRGREDGFQRNDSSESCTPAVCIMYNACTRVCNKQQGGVVRSPTGGPWSSAPRRANTVVSDIEFWGGGGVQLPADLTISILLHLFNEIRSWGP